MLQREFGNPTVIPLFTYNLSRSATEDFSIYFSYSSILVHCSENFFPWSTIGGWGKRSLQSKRGSLMQYSLIHPTHAFRKAQFIAIQMKYYANGMFRQHFRNSNTTKATLCLCRICFRSTYKYFSMFIKDKIQVQGCILCIIFNCFLDRE